MDNSARSKFYFNPYFGGVLLGLLLLLTFYLTGRGLGASGAVKNVVVASVNSVAPEHAQGSEYMGKFISDDEHPLSNWLVYEVIGVLAGAFFSGALAGRLKWKTDHGPRINAKRRLLFALIGGLLFGIGAQFARGCTSGAALSGSAALSAAGFLTMMGIFGTGYLFAALFRKLWV